jgi:hypothetical protein
LGCIVDHGWRPTFRANIQFTALFTSRKYPSQFVLAAPMGGSVINDCHGTEGEEAVDLNRDVNLFGGDRSSAAYVPLSDQGSLITSS